MEEEEEDDEDDEEDEEEEKGRELWASAHVMMEER